MESFDRMERIKLRVFDTTETEEKAHSQQDIEVLYVLQGSLQVQVEQRRIQMEREDILVINADQRHSLHSSGENILFAQFTILYQMVSDILDSLSLTFICSSADAADDSKDGSYEPLRRILQKLLAKYLERQGNTGNFGYISLCYQMLDYLCSHFLVSEKKRQARSESEKYEDRIREINHYINANYMQPISMKELSEKLYLSNGYLSRFFKKNYGMSFVEYLTNVRLHHAVDELLFTDVPITKIVYDCGFTSVAMFNKAFKEEYGETPTQMRKRESKSKKSAGEEILSEQIRQKLADALWTEIPEEETGSGELTVNCRVADARSYRKNWNQIINVGSAADIMRSEVQEHVILLREAFHYEYVRFWSPFTREMLIDVNNSEHRYNFSRLDSLLDFLVGTGFKPFIELAGKPRRINRSNDNTIVYERPQTADSAENWRGLIEAFMHHILGRFGREQISSWKFELWMDYDLLSDERATADYILRYKIAQEIVHQYSDASIGAAGMHGYAHYERKKSARIRDFHRMMQEKGAVPDFLTIYIYAYDQEESEIEDRIYPSTEADFFDRVLNNLDSDLGAFRRERPLYITEWNLTASDRNMMNDACFKGAYIVRNSLAMLERADSTAYFLGSDRVAEYYDTEEAIFGGTGLLTRDGVMKPAAFAVDFLNRLHSRMICRDENYIVTTNGHESYGILCHNCKNLNYLYYSTEEDKLDADHLSQYFENTDPLSLNFTLRDVKAESYVLRIFRINESHGSVQKVWKELGYSRAINREDIKYLRRICEPQLSMQTVIASDSTLKIGLKMQANEIAYVQIEPVI